MTDFEKISIDLDDEAEYLAKETGYTVEQANLFIDGEMAYMEKVGILCSSDEEQQSDENFVLDDDEMLDYISDSMNMASIMVKKFYAAECEYYKKIGVTEE